MIFGSVIRRAEGAVENMLDQALGRILVGILLLVAAGFATASASLFVNNRYGPELGNLVMAAAFAVVGLAAAAYFSVKTPPSAVAAEAKATALEGDAAAAGQLPDGSSLPLTGSEKELFNSLLASAAPIAVPGLTRMLLRNLPIVVALLIAIFVFTRKGVETGEPAQEKAAS